VNEMYGGAEVVRYEFEVRDDVLWSRSVHAEISFPWSRLTRVTDRPDSIELWFDPGLAVVRNRAFQTQEERRDFLESVKQHLKAGATRI
jgi:hypothetical protein